MNRQIENGKIHISRDNDFYLCGVATVESFDKKTTKAPTCLNCIKIKESRKNKKKEKK